VLRRNSSGLFAFAAAALRAQIFVEEQAFVQLADRLPAGVQVVDVVGFRERDVFACGWEGVFDWRAVAESSFENSGRVGGLEGGEELGADGGEGLLRVDV
jgi:hypothetical protein